MTIIAEGNRTRSDIAAKSLEDIVACMISSIWSSGKKEPQVHAKIKSNLRHITWTWRKLIQRMQQRLEQPCDEWLGWRVDVLAMVSQGESRASIQRGSSQLRSCWPRSLRGKAYIMISLPSGRQRARTVGCKPSHVLYQDTNMFALYGLWLHVLPQFPVILPL